MSAILSMAGIEKSTRMVLMQQKSEALYTVVNKKVSYRITYTPMVILHYNTVYAYTHTDFHETTKKDGLQALQNQFLHFSAIHLKNFFSAIHLKN